MQRLAETYWFDNVRFDCVGAYRPESTPDRFALRKTPWMAQRYTQLAEEMPAARVVELGIDEGASTAFFSYLWQQGRLISFDLSADPAQAFSAFLSEAGIEDRVKACWGVDQSDAGTISDAIHSFMGSEPLDLVVDDASHLFGPTLASFEALFPLVRPGGCYVIEDWAWELQLQRRLDRAVRSGDTEVARRLAEVPPRTDLPMAQVLPALTLLAGGHSDIVAEVTVRGPWAEIRRGSAPLDQGFSVADLIGHIGRNALVSQPQTADRQGRSWRGRRRAPTRP